jgi:branched-chain amino acid transport system ATP-binding protein
LTANSDINLDVPDGSLFAVIGPNGAGKTTFFNMVSGFLAPTAGTIEFAGEDITHLRQDRIAAKGLVRTFQLVQLFKGMTVAENVEVGFHLATKGGMAAALARLAWFRRQEADVHAKARDLLAFVGLAAQAEQDAELLPTASSACSRSHARSRQARACSCSTSQPPASMRRRPTRSPPSSRSSTATAPPCC